MKQESGSGEKMQNSIYLSNSELKFSNIRKNKIDPIF